MTVINAVARPEAAYLITDTAGYDDTRTVLGFIPKATPLPHLSCAIATTGKIFAGNQATLELSKGTSFDDLIERGPEFIRDGWDAGVFDFDGPASNDFRLFIAGFSETRRCGEVYVISTKDEGKGLAAFTMIKNTVLLSPELTEDEFHQFVPTSGKVDWGAVLTDVIKFQRRQTRYADQMGLDESDFSPVIGGHAVLTRIDATGISQRVVCRWPDRIGEPVDIAADAEVVSNAAISLPDGLSRLQRDRMERKARKLRRVS